MPGTAACLSHTRITGGVSAFILTTRNQNQAGMLKSASLLAAVWRRTEIKTPQTTPKKLIKRRGNIAEPLGMGVDATLVE